MAEGTRTKAEIEADLEASRERLVHGLVSLLNQVHPRAVAHRAAVDVRGRATSQLQALRAQLSDADGNWDLRRVALVGTAAVGAVTFVAVVRSLARR